MTKKSASRKSATPTIANAKISAIITLKPWVTLPQFEQLMQVIEEGLVRFGHLIDSYNLEPIPPGTTDFVAKVTVASVDLQEALVALQTRIESAMVDYPGYVGLQVEQDRETTS
jgi:hypothetical protein